MKNTRKLLLATAACAASAPALADLSYSQKIIVEGGGAMSMFSSEGTVINHLAGDKSRSETQMNMKSRLARLAAGSGNSVTIVRLDKALTWNLQPEDQQYQEVTFAQARAQLAKAMDAMEQSGGGVLPVSEDGCQWSDGKVEVDKTGEKEKITGIKTRKHVIRMRQSCTDPQSGKTCDMTWVMETWLASRVPGEKEVRAFQKRYLDAMGLGDAAQHMQGPAQAMLGMFGDNWETVVDELQDIKGYPLRTVMQMGMGGEQCTTASGQPIAMDQVWADASTSAYNAALDQAGYEAGSAAGQAVGESLGGSIAGRIGGAAVGAAAGELIGGFTGMFKKDKKPVEAEPAQPVTDGNKQVTLFRISTEVTNWSEVTVPPERFEVPAGWTKVKGP
ncbi:hypothetical protein F0M18_02355 [Pseudohalioglobus sediminis]|uniref:DUF4412 domain-containing protein n=1 Tax=Pseudohalioglobus sediminis TaxID=2606449 RepID=A0A5B0X6T6_9GAMM|nr:hypothetical protein [Pseudohalioglobus sediminis]KAA1194298.1 hypothetical protein F0M18_02355 [Pseudohalioglobus sediminis]